MFDWAWGLLMGVLGTLAVWAWWGRRAAQERVRLERRLATAEQAAQTMQAQQAVAQAQWQALNQAQWEAVMVVSHARLVLSLNPAAQTLFGPQAAAGQTLIFATRSMALDELVEHCLAGGADCDRQITIGQLPYRARVLPAAEPEAGVVVVLRDLSELQRLGRARRDFVANISHELRTPITSIGLLVDALRGPALTAETRAQLLEKIAIETETLAQLAQELLDLAQIESGQSIMRLVTVSVAELAARVAERLEPQRARKHQTLTLTIPPELRALADPDQVNRALGNLLHNAIKFTPPHGHLTIRAWPQANDVVIEVADTGPGIPPADRSRVFERFFRGDRARVSGGTGLGLAIAKHVVEAHGGTLWVEPSPAGAAFRFTLPPEEA